MSANVSPAGAIEAREIYIGAGLWRRLRPGECRHRARWVSDEGRCRCGQWMVDFTITREGRRYFVEYMDRLVL